MTEEQEDELLTKLQELWRDLADALGWDHIEGVNYHKNAVADYNAYITTKQKLQTLVNEML